MSARPHFSLLAVVALAAAAPAAGQVLQYDFTAGFQWVDVAGNGEMFRTQTGEQQGFRLDGLSLLVVDPSGSSFTDRVRVFAAGGPASPDSRLRLEAFRANAYRLRFDWSRNEVFNALPGYANPLQASGVFPGQHTLNRRRQRVDLDLELFPGRAVTPLVGYSRATYGGPARTTYHFGQDEFLLDSHLSERVHEFRLGVGFAVGEFRGAVLQGWRQLESTHQMSLAPGAGAGNNPRPVLGQPIQATRLELLTQADVDTPFTTAHLTGRLGQRVRLVGTFGRADADGEAAESGEMAGRFASFALQRFFARAEQSAVGRAKNLAWRGEVRAEVEIVPGVEATATYRASHLELDGHSFVTTKYFETTNFSGAFPDDLSTVLEAETAWERQETLAEAKLTARPFAWLRLWAATGQLDQDVSIVPALAEVVVPGGQGGSFERQVDRLLGGASVQLGPVTLGVDWSEEEADRPVVRTDFTERTRLRGHLAAALSSWLNLTATAAKVESSNPDPSLAYAAEVTHYGAQIAVTPWQPLTFRVAWDKYRSDSRLRILRPQDLRPDLSLYAEDGESLESSLLASFPRLTLDVGVGRSTNRGSLPFTVNRFFSRLEVGLSDRLGVLAHLERREYQEGALPEAFFDADRYGLSLRWTGQ